MGHELPKKLKIVCDIAKSCERMRKTLAEAMDIIERARRDDAAAIAEGRPGSWKHLSAAVCNLRLMMRPKPKTLAWHAEIDYYLRGEPRLRWAADIPPLVPEKARAADRARYAKVAVRKREQSRISHAKSMLRKGKLYRPRFYTRLPEWAPVGRALDARSAFLDANLTDSQRAYARELAIKRRQR